MPLVLYETHPIQVNPLLYLSTRCPTKHQVWSLGQPSSFFREDRLPKLSQMGITISGGATE